MLDTKRMSDQGSIPEKPYNKQSYAEGSIPEKSKSVDFQKPALTNIVDDFSDAVHDSIMLSSQIREKLRAINGFDESDMNDGDEPVLEPETALEHLRSLVSELKDHNNELECSLKNLNKII